MGNRTYFFRSSHTPSSRHRNACWNSLTTATQLRTNRFLASSPHALTLSYAIMNEVAAVARAKGLNVPDETVEKLIKQCTDVKEGLPSSMLFDHLAMRPMEVEVSGHPMFSRIAGRLNRSLDLPGDPRYASQ